MTTSSSPGSAISFFSPPCTQPDLLLTSTTPPTLTPTPSRTLTPPSSASGTEQAKTLPHLAVPQFEIRGRRRLFVSHSDVRKATLVHGARSVRSPQSPASRRIKPRRHSALGFRTSDFPPPGGPVPPPTQLSTINPQPM